MEEIKNKYETVFIVSSKLDEEATKAVIQKFKDLIAENGTVDNVDEWGKRHLAYPINKETEGYYVLIDFTSVPAFTAELDRIYKITDGIIRSLIIRKEA
jgi:small subunit ribosomal protein S6